jgi:hypothetical protein
LKRDEVVPERADEQRHHNEEHHHGGMHCDEHVVATRDDRAVHRDGFGQELTDQGNRRAGEAELPANSERQRAADEEKGEGGPEILQTDHLVIVGPKVFVEKPRLLVVVVALIVV